jgi:hypothetical protein
MTPTEDIRNKLRLLIDEQIPEGGTEADTAFTDAELDDILVEAVDIYAAASECWFRKAARVNRTRGGIEEATAGDERIKFVSFQQYVDFCITMAERYSQRSADGNNSILMGYDPPDVLGGDC